MRSICDDSIVVFWSIRDCSINKTLTFIQSRRRKLGMETYERRLASFVPAARKRNQPIPSTWPHPKSFSVTPATLAAAGFRYDPTPSANDNVTCVYCDKGLEGWEEGDDALDEHLKRTLGSGERCAWAVILGVKRDYDEKGIAACDPPTSKSLENARKASFGPWWTFDNKSGWKPTSQKVSVLLQQSDKISLPHT